MAKKPCALCGMSLGLFEKRELVCCGETQAFCLSCFDEMEPMDHIQRTRVLLKEGRAAVNPDAMRKVLDRIDAKEEAKRKAESTDLTCLRCGTSMVKVGRRKFQMGEENFFDTHRWDGSMELDVVRCPSCFKVEFFMPNLPGTPSAPEDDYVTCSTCGARHDPKVGCPRCAMNNAADRISSAPKSPKKSTPGKKPPWEK